ncbi:MAG: glycosyltransferase family 8 protein [Bacteroidales bacterium]|nr:glycosyltransferase family 8 protein [Bacteroidales bacterium]
MKKVPLLFAIDENLVMPTGVAITSLMQNCCKETFYDIFIIHHKDLNFNSSKLVELQKQFNNCSITFRKVDEFFKSGKGGFEIRGITKTAYYRLIAPAVIPEYDKILYSDSDVIFREDLSRFYDIELGDNLFAGVDSAPTITEDTRGYVDNELKIDLSKGYFYSGNLIINSKQIIQENKIEEFIRLSENNYKFQDMDIINLACNERILTLPPSYCLTTYIYDDMISPNSKYSEEEIKEALEKGIVHYNGPKPWVEGCLNMDIWWHYYRNSIFFEEAFAHKIWSNQRYVLERLSLSKRIKLVARYFRKGGRM